MRFYLDAAGNQLLSTSSLFFNYQTGIEDRCRLIYGALTLPRRTHNYLSNAVIVTISHVQCGHPLPCPNIVSMEIEDQMLLNEMVGHTLDLL